MYSLDNRMICAYYVYMKLPVKDQRLATLITREMRRRLDRVAEEKGILLSELIRGYLEAGLSRYEKTHPEIVEKSKTFRLAISKATPAPDAELERIFEAAETFEEPKL
jgi:hypothetical protein